MTFIEKIDYGGGLTASIYHDQDVEQPFACDDALRVVVLHRRYLDPSDAACGRDPDELAAWERENADWFTMPLFLYDHSGVIYRAAESNPFHCPWDSGRVGTVALKRSEWGSGNEPDEKLAEYAESVAAEYTLWANGECYGYVVRGQDGEELDSCWGFLSIERVREEAAAAADRARKAAALRCPRCRNSDHIDVATTVWVLFGPDGTDGGPAREGEPEWTDDSAACCHACGFQGTAGDFRGSGKAGAS